MAAGFDRQSNADYQLRRKALAAKTNGGIVLLFASTQVQGPDALREFRQNDNFFYLTGWSDPGGALLIAPAREARGDLAALPYTEILFLPKRNPWQERWTGPRLGPEDPEARQLTGFDRVEALDRMPEELARILPQPAVTIFSELGESSEGTAALEWLRRANGFQTYISLADVKPLLESLRKVKDSGEVERIRKATDASVAAHLAAMKAVHAGMSELEIANLMKYESGKGGCERLAYVPIIGSGFDSTILHYSAGPRTMHDGEVVLIDVGCEYSMYATDITRTLPVNGKFTARQREIYDIVLGAQQAAISAFKSGKSTLGAGSPDALFRVAYDYINSHGKDLHGQPLGQYFIHGLSHNVGLNVHDPTDDLPVGPGAVFTIEPGIYIPEEKLGVRIEDMFVVDAEGKLVNLTGNLPHTAEEVERTMASRP
jgi:Xaa-Pro aminopeptidase